MTAKKVALTLALGLSFGIMPLMGFTTLLLTIIAFQFRLNILAIQVIHYSVSFLQIILFIPFLKLGLYIFNVKALPFDINNIITLLQTEFIDTFLSFWQINLMGILVWSIFAIPLGLAIYYLSLPFFNKQKQKMELEVEIVKN